MEPSLALVPCECWALIFGYLRESKKLASLRLVCRSWLAAVDSPENSFACVDVVASLHETCENGHLETAKWLVARFNLTAVDVRADDNYALRLSCWYGHL